jgi:hypothetical protein
LAAKIMRSPIHIFSVAEYLEAESKMEFLGSEDTLVLDSINLSLTMADIYEDIF